MPLYEYRCPDCQGRFEIIQHLGTSAAETVCPACGAQHVERQLSTFAVSNGGSGASSSSAAPRASPAAAAVNAEWAAAAAAATGTEARRLAGFRTPS